MRRKKQKRSNDHAMRDLVTYRNDPGLIDEFYQNAISGNVDAQYALGLIYAEGRGTSEDLVKSFAWLTLCVMQGDEDAQALRLVVSENMSQDEFQLSLDLALDLRSVIDENKRYGHLTVVK